MWALPSRGSFRNCLQTKSVYSPSKDTGRGGGPVDAPQSRLSALHFSMAFRTRAFWPRKSCHELCHSAKKLIGASLITSSGNRPGGRLLRVPLKALFIYFAHYLLKRHHSSGKEFWVSQEPCSSSFAFTASSHVTLSKSLLLNLSFLVCRTGKDA